MVAGRVGRSQVDPTRLPVYIVDAKLALQGFRHPVVSADCLPDLQGVFNGANLDTRLTRQNTRFFPLDRRFFYGWRESFILL